MGGGGGGGGGGQSAVWMERSMVACRSTRYPSWSQIPPEILDLVLHRLPHSDCLNLGKVCSSWRSVFLDRRRNSRPPPCILQIPIHGAIPLQLWGLDGDQLVRFLSPKPKLYPKLPATWIVGSSADWLVIISRVGDEIYSHINLVNPISGQQISLPSVASGTVPMHRFVCKEASFNVQRIYMSSPPTTADCILVARVSYCPANYHPIQTRHLAWCRPGDCEWTRLTFQPRELHLGTCDSVFHNGQLYVLGISGEILVCTFNPLPQVTIRLPVTSVYDVNPGYKRLVVSDGEVLLVLRRAVAATISPKLHLFREQGGKWVRVKNLGDRVLLIGRYGAESLCTKDLMGSTFEPNCIYYNYYSEFLGKYCMSDQSHQEIPVPRSENKHAAQLDWIAAQVW